MSGPPARHMVFQRTVKPAHEPAVHGRQLFTDPLGQGPPHTHRTTLHTHLFAFGSWFSGLPGYTLQWNARQASFPRASHLRGTLPCSVLLHERLCALSTRISRTQSSDGESIWQTPQAGLTASSLHSSCQAHPGRMAPRFAPFRGPPPPFPR